MEILHLAVTLCSQVFSHPISNFLKNFRYAFTATEGSAYAYNHLPIDPLCFRALVTPIGLGVSHPVSRVNNI